MRLILFKTFCILIFFILMSSDIESKLLVGQCEVGGGGGRGPSKCEHWEEDGGCHISANVRI